MELANKLGNKDDAQILQKLFTQQGDALNKAFMNGTA